MGSRHVSESVITNARVHQTNDKREADPKNVGDPRLGNVRGGRCCRRRTRVRLSTTLRKGGWRKCRFSPRRRLTTGRAGSLSAGWSVHLRQWVKKSHDGEKEKLNQKYAYADGLYFIRTIGGRVWVEVDSCPSPCQCPAARRLRRLDAFLS